jgi:hypothetical protein
MSNLGKRGRLPKGIPHLGKQFYKCVVVNCDQIIRGDGITSHFRTKSKLQVLDEAKKLDGAGVLTNGLNYIEGLCVDDENQKNHTIYLLSNGYTSAKLPTMTSPEFKKKNTKPLPQFMRNFLAPSTATQAQPAQAASTSTNSVCD